MTFIKNKLIISILMGVILTPIMSIAMGFYQYSDQKSAKSNLTFKDGKTFAELENSMKKDLPNMPNTLLIHQYKAQDPMTTKLLNAIPSPFYASANLINFLKGTKPSENNLLSDEKHFILANQKFENLTSAQARWLLTHETGHSQYPYLITSIQCSLIPVWLSTAYCWTKKLGSKPYKNRFTKIGSKCIAATIVSDLSQYIAMNLEERRADNWANKHSDKKTRQGGIEAFKLIKPHLQDAWSSYKVSKIIPFSIGQYIIDPVHPSIESRIKKIEKTLQK